METNKQKTFYKRCPNCKRISGFYLTNKQVEKDDKYLCSDCQKESKLSKWTNSTETTYLKELEQRSYRINLEKLQRKIIPANKRNYGRQ